MYDYCKRKEKLNMYVKVLWTPEKFLKCKLLTPEERYKTPEIKLVYS